MKQVIFSPREQLKRGLDKVADAVKLTIGPKGRNVAIDRGYEPLVTNDGGTVANEIKLKDRLEDMGAQMIRQVVRKTSEKVGGGRTAAAILTQALVSEGMRADSAGSDMHALKAGMREALHDISEKLDKLATPVDSEESLIDVATVSTESRELGEVIGKTVWKAGKDCLVTVEEGQGTEVTTESADGLKLDRGWVSPYMVTDPTRMESSLKDVPVLVVDRKISYFKDIDPVLKKLVESQQNQLVVFCEEFDGDALNMSLVLKGRGVFTLLAVRAPGVVDRTDWLEDVALATGADLVSDKTGVKMADAKLGKARKVTATKDDTVIVGEDTGLMRAKAEQLRAVMEASQKPWERDSYEKRIARLSSAVAVIRVGAATEAEAKYLKQKVEDGVNEAKRALEEGIVPGGDCAFIHASKGLSTGDLEERGKGYRMVLKAVEAPLRQIVHNAGGSPDVVVEGLKASKGLKSGYNAITGLLEPDMHKAGIMDAVKVPKSALENAVSGAIMFLTVDCAVAEEPEDEK